MTAESYPEVVATLRTAGCVYAEDEARLLMAAAGTAAELGTMVARRAAGFPLEHILGCAEFCGIRIQVDPGVFVPRRRSELLVHEGLRLAKPAAVVLDMCCGSGAVGVAIAAALRRVELHAADIDPVAVRCAVRNVTAYGGRVYQGDLDRPLPAELRGRVDLLVANAPYVPTKAIEQMPPEARVHEPRSALDGGADGLLVQRRVAAVAGAWLRRGGHLLIETSERQADQTVEAVVANGFDARVTRCDELDATAVVGTAGRG